MQSSTAGRTTGCSPTPRCGGSRRTALRRRTSSLPAAWSASEAPGQAGEPVVSAKPAPLPEPRAPRERALRAWPAVRGPVQAAWEEPPRGRGLAAARPAAAPEPGWSRQSLQSPRLLPVAATRIRSSSRQVSTINAILLCTMSGLRGVSTTPLFCEHNYERIFTLSQRISYISDESKCPGASC